VKPFVTQKSCCAPPTPVPIAKPAPDIHPGIDNAISTPQLLFENSSACHAVEAGCSASEPCSPGPWQPSQHGFHGSAAHMIYHGMYQLSNCTLPLLRLVAAAVLALHPRQSATLAAPRPPLAGYPRSFRPSAGLLREQAAWHTPGTHGRRPAAPLSRPGSGRDAAERVLQRAGARPADRKVLAGDVRAEAACP
jgi:hypothetical protein